MKRLLLVLAMVVALALATAVPAFASEPAELACLRSGDEIIGFTIDHDGHGTRLDGRCPIP